MDKSNFTIQCLENIIEQIENLDIDNLIQIKNIDTKTFEFSTQDGDYIININNNEIWLSSPISNPKRFYYHDMSWKTHDNKYDLGDVLSKELQNYDKRLIIDTHKKN